jgi:hypothetical protein
MSTNLMGSIASRSITSMRRRARSESGAGISKNAGIRLNHSSRRGFITVKNEKSKMKNAAAMSVHFAFLIFNF